jgi:hypothetical protein
MEPMLFIASLAGLAVLIVAITHAGLVMRQSLKDASEQKIARNPEEKSPVEEKPEGLTADFSALINAIAKESKANRAEERREDDSKQAREWLTIALLVSTVVLLGWQVNEMVNVYGPISKQAEVAADTESKQLRAYVFSVIVTPLSDFSPNTERRYSATFANGGATPAYDLAYQLVAGFIPIPIDRPIEKYAPPIDPRAGRPGDYLFKEHTKPYTSAPFTLTQEQSAAVKDGKGGVFFWGGIIYTDIFRCRHYTNFCAGLYSQRGSPPSQYECPTHNDVDDPNKCDKG